MWTTNFKQDRTTSRLHLISTFLILLLFITPVSALAQDKGAIDTLRETSKTFAEIAEKASTAVVGIKAEKTVVWEYQTLPEWPFGDQFSDPFDNDLFERFFGRRFPRRYSPQRKSRQIAQGSGFIVASEGYILTNNHLVKEADKITVKLSDKREFTAKIKGTDPESDVAVLEIDADNLPHLELADSDELKVGEWVLAIGNPFGLSHSVTAGIVSAKGRSGFGISSFEDFIQTDAAINPGNSGGPLLNLDGKVVGINTFIISRSGGYMGIGFAIPVNMAKATYDQLLESGEVKRGYLGIYFEELTPELADALGLKYTKGVVIAKVIEDTAAEKAGLKHNDVVVELDGEPVESAEAFRNRVAMLKPGTRVELVVLRDGERKTFTVKLDRRPSQGEIASTSEETQERLGFTVKNLTDELAQRLGYEDLTGVLVTQVDTGSEAARKGIAAGMLIVEVNREPVKNIRDFDEAIEKAKEKGTVLLLVTDGRYNQFVVLKLTNNK